jgi:peptidyl-prolyl cis-trans isomerase A (cyclophilin A)
MTPSRNAVALTATALLVLLAACGKKEQTPAPAPAPAASAPPSTAAPTPSSPLLDPSLANQTAPATFRVRFETTKGDFVVAVTRAWAPLGADRFYNLVKIGFFEDIAFFRVIEGFMVQFGIHGDPAVSAAWRDATISDDPVKESNLRGYLTFATGGPDTRTTQLFINFKDNSRLDASGFAPIGKVVEGMEVVDSLYAGYGEGAPQGQGPSQQLAQSEGNAYFREQFPKLDYIKSATLLETAPAAEPAAGSKQ